MGTPVREDIRFDYLRENAQQDLLDIISLTRGKKALVLDRSLSATVGLFVTFPTLQDHGVDRIYYLEEGPLAVSQSTVTYLIRPTLYNINIITNQISSRLDITNEKTTFHIVFAQGSTLLCQYQLEEAGVLGDTMLSDYPLYFVPFEVDVLSLELNGSFSDLYLNGDFTPVIVTARAIMQLQERFGLFPRVTGKGKIAKKLLDALVRLKREKLVEDNLTSLSLDQSVAIESLVVIDRSSDQYTPMLTQLTYEGLLEEIFSIENGNIELDSSFLAGSAPDSSNAPTSSNQLAEPSQLIAGRKRKYALSSEDPLYGQLRDVSFTAVGSVLNTAARRLNNDYEQRHSAKTITEIKSFVGKLGGLQTEHQSLRLHTELAERVLNETNGTVFNRILELQQNLISGIDPLSQVADIEELMARNVSVKQVLRLLCLLSSVSGGLKSRDYDQLRQSFIMAYGPQYLITFEKLSKANLFNKRSANANTSSSSYNQIRKAFNLVVDEINERTPDDIAYVYSGYAPLSVRLTQCIFEKSALKESNSTTTDSYQKKQTSKTINIASSLSSTVGWRGFEEPLTLLQGPAFDEVQRGDSQAARAQGQLQGPRKKAIMVLFMGGCTYTEISAIRYIAKKQDRQIVIATTCFISGNKIIEQFLP